MWGLPPSLLLLLSGCALLSLSCGQLEERLEPAPTYLLAAPRKVRPNQIVTMSATLLRLEYEKINFRVLIKRDDTEICSVSREFDAPGTQVMQMKMPENTVVANYTLRVEGTTGSGYGGFLFENETALQFDSKQISLFIQLSKPLYKQEQTVRFRVVPLQTNLQPSHTDMNIFVYDANGGLVRRWLNQQTNSGILSREFRLGKPYIAFGTWTIKVVALGHEYFKNFVVEEFYGPRFYVNVSTAQYIMSDSFGLSGTVSSNHSSGYATRGNGTITLTIIDPSKSSTQSPTITRDIPYFHGRTDFLFTRQEMEDIAGGNLAGKMLRVDASVMDYYQMGTGKGWQIAKVYSHDIVLEWLGDHVRSFKPGMPYTVYLSASNEDRTPITTQRRLVTISESHRRINNGGTVTKEDKEYTLPSSGILSLIITPELNDELITLEARYEDFSTRYKMQAYRQYSPSDSYIQITTSTTDTKVNEYMIFNVHTNTIVDQLYYMIVASGNIVFTETLMMFSRHKTFSVALSRDMVPSARIIVYFIHPTTAEVVSDSMNFYVKGTSMNTMKVKLNRGKDFSGNTVEIQATSDPGAFVCLSAMEYYVYSLGANNGLTQEMVIDELLTYDAHANSSFGHTWYLPDQKQKRVYYPSPTYAPDANKTFAFAGLHVFTDAKLIEVKHNCNFTLGWLPCWNGECYRNHTRCNGVFDCKKDGADEFGCEKSDTFQVDTKFWNSKHIDHHFLDYDWLWEQAYTKPDGRIDIKVKVPNHPGSWVINAFGMSRNKGLGFLGSPARYDATRPFYMVVENAQHVRFGEQVGFRVTIFNYWDTEIEVLTWLHDSPDYDFVIVDHGGNVNSYAPRTGSKDMQTLVVVKAGTSRYVFFPVLPKKVGHVEVTISAMSFVGAETVKKTFYVEANGVTNYYHTPFLLDLLNTGSLILPEFNITIPAEFIQPETSWHLYVPGSQKVTVSAVGDVIGPGIYDDFVTSLSVLREPYACGEQSMFNFAYNLYNLKFLKDTNQLRDDILKTTLEGLNLGLQENDAYYREEGMFAWMLVFEDWSQPSVWLTAFTVATMHDAIVADWVNDFFIDISMLDKMALWLCSQQNMEGPLKGSFKELAQVYDRNMRSPYTEVNGVQVKENVTLTAYVLISLSKLTKLTSWNDARAKVDQAQKLAQDFLGTKVETITDPYTMAIVCYALHVSESTRKSAAYQRLKSMKTESEYDYWSPVVIAPNPSATINTIEYIDARIPQDYEATAVAASSYALMSYLLNGDRDEGSLVMKWLQTMRNTVGGFSATADTIVALQALTEYAKRDTDRTSYNMKITVSARDFVKTLEFTRDNYAYLQRIELPVQFGSVKISAQGSGLALVQLETQVNVEYPFLLRQPPVSAYGVQLVNVTFSGRNLSIFDADACAIWRRTSVSAQSGMSILEVELPSGYEIRNTVLNKLVADNIYPRVKKAEYTNKRAIYYFVYLDSSWTCVHVRAERWYPVANYTREYEVRVYDYYQTSNHNTSMYWAEGLTRLDVCQVCGSWQCPYCPFYNTATSGAGFSIVLLVTSVLVSVSLQLDHLQSRRIC